MAYYLCLFFIVMSVISGLGALFSHKDDPQGPKLSLLAIACALIGMALK